MNATDSKRDFINLLETRGPDNDAIYKRAYFMFRSQNILKERVETSDELKDDITDGVIEYLALSTPTSSLLSFMNLFVSPGFRYMTDVEVKYNIKRKIVVWGITLIASTLLLYVITKFQ